MAEREMIASNHKNTYASSALADANKVSGSWPYSTIHLPQVSLYQIRLITWFMIEYDMALESHRASSIL